MLRAVVRCFLIGPFAGDGSATTRFCCSHQSQRLCGSNLCAQYTDPLQRHSDVKIELHRLTLSQICSLQKLTQICLRVIALANCTRVKHWHNERSRRRGRPRARIVNLFGHAKNAWAPVAQNWARVVRLGGDGPIGRGWSAPAAS